MVWTYLDIETYSREKEPRFDDKVILVALREIKGKIVTEKLFTEWELGSERKIAEEFHNYARKILNQERTTWFIGFNILLFDRPLLVHKIVNFNISPLFDILQLFKKIYWRDLRIALLPFNKMTFSGLSAEKIAEKLTKVGLGCRKPLYSNKEIKDFYETRKFSEIEEHAKSDLNFISDLNYNLAYKMDEVMKALRLFKDTS